VILFLFFSLKKKWVASPDHIQNPLNFLGSIESLSPLYQDRVLRDIRDSVDSVVLQKVFSKAFLSATPILQPGVAKANLAKKCLF